MSHDGDGHVLLHHGARVSISVPRPSRIPHVHGRGTADPLRSPGGSRSDGAGYSSHHCVGDMSTVKPRANRLCVLRNVCMDTASGNVLYYRNPNATQAPVVFDQRYGHIFSFGHVAPKGGREDLLPLNKHVRYKRHVRWSPRMVERPMPRAVPIARTLHVLSAPFVPTNLGHLVWEEAFPLLLAMAQLGEYEDASSTVVLRTHACNATVAGVAEPPSPSEARLCHKFVEGFVRPLGAVRTLSSLRDAAARAGRRHVCFSRLIGGGFFEMFNAPEHAGKEPFLQLYRQRVLAYHGLVPHRAPAPPPTDHTLLVIRKQGRRGIANVEEVLRYVRKGCEGLCELPPRGRVLAAAFHTMSVREQLRLVSTATLAISPPGGVSMILPFLPEGAHAVLLNYMLAPGAAAGTERHGPADKPAACAKCSLTMEAALWRHMRHVRTLFYQVWEPSDFARGRPGRDAAIVVKLPRLGYLLRLALDAMAPSAALGGAEDS